MVALLVLFIGSFVFFILSAVFSAVGGGNSSNVLERGNIAGLGESNSADAFSKVSMSLRIMPSHKTEGNMLIMVPGEGTAEW